MLSDAKNAKKGTDTLTIIGWFSEKKLASVHSDIIHLIYYARTESNKGQLVPRTGVVAVFGILTVSFHLLRNSPPGGAKIGIRKKGTQSCLFRPQQHSSKPNGCFFKTRYFCM